ncbi:hypothetical protein ScPMuIL_011807 [Solemya velum]
MEVPVILCMQKLVVYETKARLYIVGSNMTESRFRVLKIDRTEPKELIINDDKIEYTRKEIRNLLTMIDSGNRSWATQKGNIGLVKSVSAFGIAGFTRFLEGYYIILITKRRKVALIGPHTIYKIEDTAMMYIPNDNVRYTHPDENRYVKMFQNVDLSSNFYFSYSYDLTHTLQYNMASSLIPSSVPEPEFSQWNADNQSSSSNSPSDSDLSKTPHAELSSDSVIYSGNPASTGQPTPEIIPDDATSSSTNYCGNDQKNAKSADQSDPQLSTSSTKRKRRGVLVNGVRLKPTYKYVWNTHLLNQYEEVVHTDWILYIVHGFIGQCNISVYGKPIYLTLIARRSAKFAGTRFLKRGINCDGDVANEIETEQIVHDASITYLNKAKITSFVQLRGSVPLYWSQDVSTMVPKPPIILDKRDPFAHSGGRNFREVIKRYGAPLIILNLVKRREKRRHESILSEEFKQVVRYLNQFLPHDHAIKYIGFDMAHLSKSKNKNVLARLAEIANYCVKLTGFFFKAGKEVSDDFWENEKFHGFQGYKDRYGCKQTGIARTNCVDCLDRTNTAQFALGKCALGYQLYALGVTASPDLTFDTDCLRMLEELYEDQGDTLALQYGGSQLVHRIKGYRKISPLAAHSRDIMQTLSRYYSNTFSDLEKQQAINVFLGVFKPKEGKPNIWELPTDYYLHNKEVPVRTASLKNYTEWLEFPAYRCLPLPYNEVSKPSNVRHLLQIEKNDMKVNEYWEYYHPYEITNMEELYAFSVTHSLKHFMPKLATDYSPFTLRITPVRNREAGLEANPNICGKDSTASITSTTSTGSEESTSSTDSLDLEGNVCISDSSFSSYTELLTPREEPGYIWECKYTRLKDIYDTELKHSSKRDMHTFERYVDLGKACCKKPSQAIQSDVPQITAFQPDIEIFPISAFKLDSSYEVEPPPVSRQAKDIYTNYVLCGLYGPSHPSKQDMRLYMKYNMQLYQ